MHMVANRRAAKIISFWPYSAINSRILCGLAYHYCNKRRSFGFDHSYRKHAVICQEVYSLRTSLPVSEIESF